MRLQLIPFDEIDFIRYDGCVNNSRNYTIFGLSWFLKAVIGKFDILVYGNYEAVMPLPYYFLRLGGKAVIHHPLTSRLGIYSSKNLSEKKVRAFIDFLPPTYKNIQIFFNKDNPINSDIFPFSRMRHRIFKLDLHPNYENIKLRYSPEIQSVLDEGKKNINLTPVQLDLVEAVRYFAKFTRIKTWSHVLLRLLEEIKRRGLLYPLHLQDDQGNIQSVSFFIEKERVITQLVLASVKADPYAQIYTLDRLIEDFAGRGYIIDMNTIQASLAQNFSAEPVYFYSLTHLRKRDKWLHSLGLNIYTGR